jgi:hypothetical protein
VFNAGQEGEQEALRRTMGGCGRRSWLTARVAEYGAAAPRRRRARRDAGAPAVPEAVAVAGRRRPPPLRGSGRIPPGGGGRGADGGCAGGEVHPVPLARPVQGWVLGKVARVSRAAGFSHGVRYARGPGRPSAGGRQPRSWTPPRTARGLLAGGYCSASARARPQASFGFNGTTLMGRGHWQVRPRAGGPGRPGP